MRKLIAVVLPMLPLWAFPQSLPYSDADNPGEAVGLLKATVITSKAVLAECTKRFPDQGSRMRSDLETWRDQEADVIARAEFFWEEMKRKDPKLADMEAFLASAALKPFEILDSVPTSGGESQPQIQVISQYCSKYFHDLASGVWRVRTPKTYEYLDDAPEPSA